MNVASTRTWSGQLFFGPGRLLYAGPVGETGLHAHHTFQVVLALDEPVRLQDVRLSTVACWAAVVPPRAAHAVVGACRSALLLHVAADDAVGRRLRTLGIPADDAGEWARAGARLAALAPERLPRGWHEADLLVGKPRRDPDPSGDWRCPYLVEGLPHARRRYAHGIDSLQALQMAIEAAKGAINAAGLVCTHSGSEPGDIGIPRIIPTFGGAARDFAPRIERYLDQELEKLAAEVNPG